MKTLTIEQLASKYATAKTNSTKSKYQIYAIDNLSKEDYFKFLEIVNKIERENNQFMFANCSDSMVR